MPDNQLIGLAKDFFQKYAQQEQCFLDYLVNAEATDLNVYYDAQSQQICRKNIDASAQHS